MSKDRFVTGYSDFSLKMPGPLSITGCMADAMLIAGFRLDTDVSQLFPYINAVAEDAVYYEKPLFIRFMLDGFRCAFHPDSGVAAPFEDDRQALEFMDRLIAFLNDIYLRKDSIEPNYKRYRPISVLDIFRLLPQTNCRECGFATCMAFAAALSKQETAPDQCPGFSSPISENAVYPVYDKQGNLLSTVTIDTDTAKIKRDSKKKQEHIKSVEKKLASTIQADRTVAGKGNDSLPTSLTNRELEVLRLVTEGASNPEISETLYISPHTVKAHVVHIFNKLGVNDRPQAAVWATRHKIF